MSERITHVSRPIEIPDRPAFERRFWANVDRSSTDSCWIWLGNHGSNGYGRISLGNRATGAHRIAYFLTYGPIPQGMLVCHSCDNQSCVNPAHLWLGDVVHNNRDMVKKGRASGNRRTVGNGRAVQKLTEPQAREIYRRAHCGETYASIATRFGVCVNTVGMIKRRELWRYVNG